MNDTKLAQFGAGQTAARPLGHIRSPLRLLRGGEIGELRAPDWIIEGIQISDALAMTYGPAGGGKSFHVLDKFLHIAAGKPFHGREVKQGPVVYIAGEGRIGIAKRVRAWCEFHGYNLNDLPFYMTSKAVAFLDAVAVGELSDVLHNMKENPVAVGIDTVARNFGDGDENSTKDMSAFVDALDRIRVETGACIEVVHHTGKDETKGGRGNSALRGALDTEIAVKPREGGFRLTCTKQKDAEPFEDTVFKFAEVDLGKVEGKQIQSRVPVLDTAPQVSTSGSRLGDCQRAGIELLRRFHRRALERGVHAGSFIIEKKKLRESLQDSSLCPDGNTYSQSSAYEFPTFAIKEGYAREVDKKHIAIVEGEWLE